MPSGCLKCSLLCAGRLLLGQNQVFDLRHQVDQLAADLLLFLALLVGVALGVLLLPALTLAHQLLHHQALVGGQQLLLLLWDHTTPQTVQTDTLQLLVVIAKWELEVGCGTVGIRPTRVPMTWGTQRPGACSMHWVLA